VFSACLAALKCRPVLHHCVVIFFWSSGIMGPYSQIIILGSDFDFDLNSDFPESIFKTAFTNGFRLRLSWDYLCRWFKRPLRCLVTLAGARVRSFKMADVTAANVKCPAWSELSERRLVDIVTENWPLLFGEVKGCKAVRISVTRRKKWADIATIISK